jgi:YidC/Oxa1 family membrane protein insertase
VLAIVGLVVVIRIILIPLFVRQIRAQRNMQLIQPKIKEIQKKYAGDREKQSAEMMKLYKETGTNPLASCLPIILQAPIFFALFRVLQDVASATPVGALTPELVKQAHDSSILGVPIYGTFALAAETPNPLATKILAVTLIIAMSVTTFVTQRQLLMKNTAADNPMVKQQKVLMYIFPVIFAVGGFNFPIGVLVYWTTTNLWTMGQQFYVIRNNPQPGTPAHKAHLERQKVKEKQKAAKANPELAAALAAEEAAALEVAKNPTNKGTTVQNRQQPKRQTKSKRQPQAGGQPKKSPAAEGQASGSASSQGKGQTAKPPPGQQGKGRGKGSQKKPPTKPPAGT